MAQQSYEASGERAGSEGEGIGIEPGAHRAGGAGTDGHLLDVLFQFAVVCPKMPIKERDLALGGKDSREESTEHLPEKRGLRVSEELEQKIEEMKQSQLKASTEPIKSISFLCLLCLLSSLTLKTQTGRLSASLRSRKLERRDVHTNIQDSSGDLIGRAGERAQSEGN